MGGRNRPDNVDSTDNHSAGIGSARHAADLLASKPSLGNK